MEMTADAEVASYIYAGWWLLNWTESVRMIFLFGF